MSETAHKNRSLAAMLCQVFTLSKDETGCIKGLAILIMLAHHLYGMFGVDVAEPLRYSETVVECAIYGRVCVCMFAFVTGYGFYHIAKKDESFPVVAAFKRLRGFYPLFFTILLFRTALAVWDPACSLVPMDGWGDAVTALVYSATGVVCCFPDYWYISLFVFACLGFYPLLLWGRRHGDWTSAVMVFLLLLFCVFAEEIWNKCFGLLYIKTSSDIVQDIQQGAYFEACPFMIYVLIGWSVAWLAQARRAFSVTVPLLVLLCAACLWEPMFAIMTLCLVAAVLLNRTWFGSWLRELGVLSAVMWLTHRLIFGYWFADFFYSVPVPLNYLVLVVLSAVLAWLFLWVWRAVPRLFRRKQAG